MQPRDLHTGEIDISSELASLRHRQPGPLESEVLTEYVSRHFQSREKLLAMWEEGGARPLYYLDEAAIVRRAQEFRTAFEAELPHTRFYFAVKSNNCPDVARTVLTAGFGLDVSSGMELEMALALGAKDIIFSGPGKTADEMTLAVTRSDTVTMLVDSFGELDRLGEVAQRADRIVRAGVRLTPPGPGGWRKFGIPIDRLHEFITRAGQIPSIHLVGIQFHTSWNLDPRAQIETIESLGKELRRWPGDLARRIEFLDIGGGFWPPAGEWLQHAVTPLGQLEAILNGHSHGTPSPARYRAPAQPIVRFAKSLAEALREHILPTVACRICLEPGRWISNEAMHLLVSVVDKKAADLVITDAGTNAVGWERFEHDYFPILNLTRPAMREHACLVCGSLCTPHDLWGYAYWGDGIEVGDVLLIPDQGAYTYSLRQEFIKPLPDVVVG